MLRFASNQQWVAVYIIGIALLVIVPTAVFSLSLNPTIILMFSIAVLSGGFFGELRDTWATARRFSFARMFFRTFEWLSLAVAGYIALSVSSVNPSAST